MTTRKIFGVAGLFLEGRYFGVISDGTLYLRTDDESRAAYQDLGMRAFQPKSRPRGPKTVDRNLEVPPKVLADPATLKAWAERAAASKR